MTVQISRTETATSFEWTGITTEAAVIRVDTDAPVRQVEVSIGSESVEGTAIAITSSRPLRPAAAASPR